MATLTIPQRFCGPPVSGNGGWTAGALAEQLATQAGSGPATVRLRTPPPLEVELDVAFGDEGDTAVLLLGTAVVAEAGRAGAVTPVPPVDAAIAREAEAAYAGFRSTHPFPGCFVCGPERAVGDGLRIFPGRVPGPSGPAGSHLRTGQVAATWTPPHDVDLPITWAALDCTGGWASDLEARPSVLGTITVEVHTLPEVGVEHVVVGEERRVEGRKMFTAASLYSPDGVVVASAEHVWINIDPTAFQ